MIKYEDILKKIKYYEARKAKNDEKLEQLNEENLTLTSTLKLLNQKKEVLEKMESELSDLIPSKKKNVAK
jgi:3-deoxy-D-manno-octulosonic-acid transferase